MNILEQQAKNRRRTVLVMAVFIAFLFFLGYGVDLFYLGTDVPVAGFVAFLVGLVSALTSYYSGDRAVLASSSAKPIDELLSAATEQNRLKLTELRNVVDEMAIAAGLPSPKVYLIPDHDPNAFATGRDPDHASIAVTEGLLDSLNREELQAVVAHEMSHVRNYDIRLMTVVAALVGAIALLSDWAVRGMRWGGGGSRRGGGRDKGGGAAGLIFLVLWIVSILLAPVIGQALAMMVSRRREYLADASGAELTRNPLALAKALEKIEFAADPTRAIKRGTASLCIADPLGRKAGLREGFAAELFASHPPMVKRISALREMAYTR
jgi:heat shock protein HtpX